MASTHVLIKSNTVTSGGATSVVFSNIPQTYTDLKLVWSVRTDNASIGQSMGVQLNSTTSGYAWKALWGNGSNAPSSGASSQSDMYVGETTGANATGSVFGSGEVYIPNYTSGEAKSLSSEAVSENNAQSANVFLTAALSGVTAPITSLTIRPYGGGQTIQQYSTFCLYGIKNS